jgi:dTDP-4-dehydrorhamnose reductase
MSWLIVGGDGRIGSALFRVWSLEERVVHSTTREKTSVSDTRPYLDLGVDRSDFHLGLYDRAVLCIGESRIQYCESRPTETRLINVERTVQLARALSRAGCYVLFLSSSQVFDGKTRSNSVWKAPNPTTEYGRQKFEAEKGIDQLKNSGILRLTKVLDPDIELVKSWRESLDSGRAIYPFSNVFVAPISMGKVVKRVTELLEQKSLGIHHLSSTNLISYLDLARKLCYQWGLDSSLIIPRLAPETPIYPRYSSLI